MQFKLMQPRSTSQKFSRPRKSIGDLKEWRWLLQRTFIFKLWH